MPEAVLYKPLPPVGPVSDEIISDDDWGWKGADRTIQ